MSKRSWVEANLPSPNISSGSHGINTSSIMSPAQSYHSDAHSASSKQLRLAPDEAVTSSPIKGTTKSHKAAGNSLHLDQQSRLPGISRKVKACAACRKQKVSIAVAKNTFLSLISCLIRSSALWLETLHVSGAKREGFPAVWIKACKLSCRKTRNGNHLWRKTFPWCLIHWNKSFNLCHFLHCPLLRAPCKIPQCS